MNRTLPLALAASLAAAIPAQALGPVAFGPNLTTSGWETLTIRGRAPAEFRADRPGAVAIHADNGVAVLYRPLSAAFAVLR